MSAFYALTISTLVYSVLGGEILEVARSRAATEELIAGVPFGLAAMLLFYAVANLMHYSDIGMLATSVTRLIAVVLVPALTMFYIVNGVGDTETARALADGDQIICDGGAPLPALGINLSAALFGTMVIALALGQSLRPWRRVLHSVGTVGPILVVLATTAAAVAIGYVSTAPPTVLLSVHLVDVYLIATFALLVVCGVLLSGTPTDHLPARRSPQA